MIAVDTSAIVAILWNEQESRSFRDKLGDAGEAVISAGNLLELEFVLARTQASAGSDTLEALFDAYRIAVRPFDLDQLRIAREAALRYGKGRHRAALNFGDCFTYANCLPDAVSAASDGR
jgi:ribonuclease VapC